MAKVAHIRVNNGKLETKVTTIKAPKSRAKATAFNTSKGIEKNKVHSIDTINTTLEQVTAFNDTVEKRVTADLSTVLDFSFNLVNICKENDIKSGNGFTKLKKVSPELYEALSVTPYIKKCRQHGMAIVRTLGLTYDKPFCALNGLTSDFQITTNNDVTWLPKNWTEMSASRIYALIPTDLLKEQSTQPAKITKSGSAGNVSKGKPTAPKETTVQLKSIDLDAMATNTIKTFTDHGIDPEQYITLLRMKFEKATATK